LKEFVKRLLGGSETSPQEAVKPCLPAGERLYCVGDIHGRLDLLINLQEQIVADAASFSGDKSVVYLGDYIDRGDESRQVVDRLLESPLEGFESVHLLGNHEQTLLDFLKHPESVAAWLTYGGRATLHSYGVTATSQHVMQDLADLRDELESSLPPEHLEFYRRLELYHLAGNYCFVHAGIRPGVPLPEQREQDLLWIRDDFTASENVHDYVVVHGHTITPQVEFCHNRIGIDTGAFHSGVLTCLVLEAEDQRLLATEGRG